MGENMSKGFVFSGNAGLQYAKENDLLAAFLWRN